MDHDRRTFLKTTSIAAAMAAASLPTATQAVAQSGPKASEPKELPKGMTFATLRRPDRLRSRACAPTAASSTWSPRSRISARARRPPSTRCSRARAISTALKRLVDKASASASADRYFVADRQGGVRPVRDQSGKDRLHRPQLPQARGRDRQPGAEAADPVQQVQHRAQLPRRHHRRVRGGRAEVRLRGRAGDRDRPPRAQRHRSRRAELHLRLRHRQRLHRARPAVALDPVDARQERSTARRRSGRGWSPPTRSTATTSRSSAGSTARCASRRTRPTWCSTASSW